MENEDSSVSSREVECEETSAISPEVVRANEGVKHQQVTPPTVDSTALGVVVVTAAPLSAVSGAAPMKIAMASPKGTTSPVGAAGHDLASKTKLTKKEMEEQKAERERVKAEMKAKREEERLKKEHEKQLREEEKRERQLKREQEVKERQEKREREELEKKERKEKREAEKRKRDEEKDKKLEEKRKLEQEKEQQKEEKLRREKQAKLKFRGYFGKVEKPTVKKEEVSSETMLTAFSIKDGMSLAKAPREPLQSTLEFDRLVLVQSPDFTSDYIQSVSRKISPRQIEATVEDDSVIVVSDDPPKQSLPKFKLLQFKENHRPAYYGSWRRARGSITPRNPLKKDKGLLDYEVDSDDEWEEEEPGESISSSEGEEKEGEAEGEDSDEDDGFFVPHGYLSNDEGDCSDSGDPIPGPGEDHSESKRSRQLAKSWEAEFARKCQPLQPKAIGCIWLQLPAQSPCGDQGKRKLSSEESFLMQFAVVPLVSLPISPAPVATKGETSAQRMEGQGGFCSNAEAMKQSVPEEAMPDLIRFIHKSTFGVSKITKTFRTHWGAKISMDSPQKTPPSQPPSQTNSTSHPPPDIIDSTPNTNQHKIGSTPTTTNQHKIDSTPTTTNQHNIDSTPKSTNRHEDYENASKISKRQLERRIQAIAVKEIRPPISKAVWYVHDVVLKQYGLEKDNFTTLVPSGSPFLSARSAEQTTAKSFITPETPQQKVSKRKSGFVGKSLLDFLSRSPADKSQILSPLKRLKVDPSTSPAVKNDVDPPDSKSGSVGKSLLDFLSRSPADKSQIFSPPKRLKVDPSISPAVKCNNVDPPDSKSGFVGKSLLDFLSRSPADKSSPPKCLKVDPSTSPTVKCNDVFILDPPDSVSDGPPTKRPCLNTAAISDDHKNKGSKTNASTVDQDMIILDLPDSTSDVLAKASQVTVSDNLGNGGGISHDDNNMASGIPCL